MNLSTIIKEAENKFDEQFPTMDWEDGASTKEARRMQENVKSFLTEQIKLAYEAGYEDGKSIERTAMVTALSDELRSRTSQEDRGV